MHRGLWYIQPDTTSWQTYRRREESHVGHVDSE